MSALTTDVGLADLESLVSVGELDPLDVERFGATLNPAWEITEWGQEVSDAIAAAIRYSLGMPDGAPAVFLSLPPRHGKTTRVELGVALGFAISPDLEVLASAYNNTVARKFVRNVRRVMSSPQYQSRYGTRVGVTQIVENGQLKKIKGTADANLLRMLDLHGERNGYLLAQGTGGSATSWGAKLFVIDDPYKNYAEAISPPIVASKEAWWDTTMETRLESHAAIIMMTTRWTGNDLYNYGKKRLQRMKVPILERRFPAILDEPPEAYDRRKMGESLRFRGRKDAWYEARRAGLAAVPHIFDAMWQQRDSSLANAEFKEEIWGKFDPETFGEIVWDAAFISIDPNQVQGAPSNAALEVYFAKGPHLYKVDEDVGQWGWNELVPRTMALCRKWAAARPVVVEYAVNGIPLCDELEAAGVVVEKWTDLKLGKELRATLVAPELVAGWTLLPSKSWGAIRADWVPEHVLEWRKFPRGRPNDRIDAGVQARRWWRKNHQRFGAVWPLVEPSLALIG